MSSVLTVTQINTYIKSVIDGDINLKNVYVSGEISNFTNHYRTGHFYFTLKDGAAQIACVLFAGRRAGISFRMEDGQSVIVFGSISVYERDRKYRPWSTPFLKSGITHKIRRNTLQCLPPFIYFLIDVPIIYHFSLSVKDFFEPFRFVHKMFTITNVKYFP